MNQFVLLLTDEEVKELSGILDLVDQISKVDSQAEILVSYMANQLGLDLNMAMSRVIEEIDLPYLKDVMIAVEDLDNGIA